MSNAQLSQLEKEREVSLKHTRQANDLKIAKEAALAQIESKKFARTMATIGPDTIASIARAGPEMQAELLKGLGLQGFLVTDGTNPVNLFQTANQMITPGRP
jgi:major vault protein